MSQEQDPTTDNQLPKDITAVTENGIKEAYTLRFVQAVGVLKDILLEDNDWWTNLQDSFIGLKTADIPNLKIKADTTLIPLIPSFWMINPGGSLIKNVPTTKVTLSPLGEITFVPVTEFPKFKPDAINKRISYPFAVKTGFPFIISEVDIHTSYGIEMPLQGIIHINAAISVYRMSVSGPLAFRISHDSDRIWDEKSAAAIKQYQTIYTEHRINGRRLTAGKF
jgi:hypothetical protein